ncbi:MAG: hypothetical protein HY294_04700 [Candidatus Rokubacteria bacterium]|nr:hypothetical protein [Candidatus Rokubacteria bacterium]
MAPARSPRRSFPVWKYSLFAAIAVLVSLAVVGGALLATDLFLHRKFEKAAGLNVWGYRGPVVGRKQAGERRVIVLGGSTAFGYGVRAGEAFPAVLERSLRARGRERGGGAVSVVNLAYNNEGAHSFRFTLDDYQYLRADVVLIYTGYNDLGRPGANTYVFRHDSPIFRLTGYMPILPLVLREKAILLRHGNLEAAYRGEKTTFRPNLAQRLTASTYESAMSVTQSLERQLGRLSPETRTPRPGTATECTSRWRTYCDEVAAAVDLALARGQRVLVVAEPYISDEHVQQQAELAAMLAARFGAQPRVRRVDLGRAVDLHDPALAYDGMHLTVQGNERIAARLVGPVADLLETL